MSASFLGQLLERRRRARINEFLFPACLLLFCTAVLVYAVMRPNLNWDMVAYVGAAKAWDTDDAQVIHDFAYSELQAFASESDFERLTVSSTYRSIYHDDPEAFRQSLGYYAIRPVYTGALNLLHKAGMNIYLASYLLPALATVLGIGLFYWAFRGHVTGLLWYALPFDLIMNGTVAIARLSTPDGLAYACIALLTGLFLRRSRWLFVALPLTVLIRTDLIILVGLILGYRFLVARADRVLSLISLAASLALYLSITVWAENHGWQTLFYLVFVSDFSLNYPATTEVTISVRDYVVALVGRVPVLLQSDEFAGYAAITVLISALVLRLDGFAGSVRAAVKDPLYALPLIGLLFVLVHFLIFPAGLPRFYAAHYTSAFLVLLAVLTRLCRRLEPRPEERADRSRG